MHFFLLLEQETMDKLQHCKEQIEARYNKMKKVDNRVWRAFNKCVKLTDGFHYSNDLSFNKYIYSFGLDSDKFEFASVRMLKFYDELISKFKEDENCEIIGTNLAGTYNVRIHYKLL